MEKIKKITLFPFQQRIIDQIENAETNQIFLMSRASSKTFIANYIKNNNLCQSRKIIDELNSKSAKNTELFFEDFFNSNNKTLLTSINGNNLHLYCYMVWHYAQLNDDNKILLNKQYKHIIINQITYKDIQNEVPYYYDEKLLNEYKIKNPKTFRQEFECQFA